MLSKARYVVLEGSDGCGKSTLSQGLARWLLSNGYETVVTREPGSHLNSFNVRDLLLSDRKVDSIALEMLFEADRAEHTSHVSRLISKNVWVLSDRSYISGLAYAQACGHGVDLVASLMNVAIHRFPDLCLFIDLDPDAAAERMKTRGEAETREESKGMEHRWNVYRAFKRLIADSCQVGCLPSMTCRTLDGTLPVDQLLASAQNHIQEYCRATSSET